MINIESARELLRYSDWANEQCLRAWSGLSAAQLDRPFDMGIGSLRKTMLHIYNGEHVWLQRWKGLTETAWPSEEDPISSATLMERFGATWRERDQFLSTLLESDFSRNVIYRDSRGSLFTAALGTMVIQMIVHSTHHRSQAVNMIRRVEGVSPELDYMVWMRQPA